MHTAFNSPYRQSGNEISIESVRRPRPAPLRTIELLAVGGLATAFALAVWNSGGPSAGGYGMAIVFAVTPILLAIAAQRVRLSPRLAVLAVLLAAASVRLAWCVSGATVSVAFALVVAFSVALRARSASVLETARTLSCAVPRLPSRVVALASGVKRLLGGTQLGQRRLLPVVVPLALTGMFAGVFALANPVVAGVMNRAWKIAGGASTPSGFQIAIWVVALVASVPLVRPALVFRKNDETLATSEVASVTNLLVVRNALIAVNAIFAAYNALDVAHLWAGSPPSGMSTQTYAHQGAVWLTIALAMMSAVVSALFRGPVATDPNGRLARSLGWLWLAQGVLLAAGTYRRIGIHIATSGLSSLRIAGVLGTTVVVLGVGLVAYKLFARRSMMWLVRRQLDTVAAAVVVFAIAPTHLISARVNVERIQHGEYRPLVHVAEQADEVESATALLPLLTHPDVRVREGVAGLLLRQRDRLVRADAQFSPILVRDIVSVRTSVRLDSRIGDLRSMPGELEGAVAARNVLYELQLAANRGEDLTLVKSAAARAVVPREN